MRIAFVEVGDRAVVLSIGRQDRPADEMGLHVVRIEPQGLGRILDRLADLALRQQRRRAIAVGLREVRIELDGL